MLPLALGLALLTGCERHDVSVPQGIQVYFSPQGGCTEAIVDVLNHATNSVYVQAFSFTSTPIARALVDAHQRKVNVRVILDDSQRSEKYTEADFLEHYGIPPLIDSKHAIAHNKVMVVDEGIVITGSFNFTKSAEEKNAENLLVINDPALARKYLDNWHRHEAHAEPFQKPVSEKPATRTRQTRK